MDLNTSSEFLQRQRESESSEEEFRSDTQSFEDLLKQSGVYPGVTSDYSSGNEDFAGDNNNNSHFVHETFETKFYSKCQRRLVHQTSHLADLLANTVASVDYNKEVELPVFQMAEPDPSKPLPRRIYKLVLTGGPCGGKTTGQDRLATFFENAGWKVFTVPEAATVLLSGGVKFAELNDEQSYNFQRDLLSTLLQIEQVFFNQAELVTERNVLIICDRGAMDPSAYMPVNGWERILGELGLSQFELRENRYNQIVHMVTAADGAEKYYTVANNVARSEGVREALNMDRSTRSAWVGHPYVDIVDNSDVKKFDDKILKLISVVCDRVGLDYQDRLSKNSRKRKWLVIAKDDVRFPKFEEFQVTHDYLRADKPDTQVRIRKRTQNNRSTYTITNRQYMGEAGPIETRMQITQREYQFYQTMKDLNRATLHKKRRCFNYGSQYFHLDVYVDPLPPMCDGKQMMILETYTTKPVGDEEPELPDFLTINGEITMDQNFSMYQLARTKSAIDEARNQSSTPFSESKITLNGTANSI